MTAQRIVCDATTEQGLVRALSYFILKGNAVYVFLGYSGRDRFDGYFPVFDQTMSQFKNLTDSRRINVKADRLVLKRTASNGNLRQALQRFGVPENQWEAAAILNGKKLDDVLPANTLLKVVAK
jgi:hypothetical protein